MKSEFLDGFVGKTIDVTLTDGRRAAGVLQKQGQVYFIKIGDKKSYYFRASAVRSFTEG